MRAAIFVVVTAALVVFTLLRPGGVSTSSADLVALPAPAASMSANQLESQSVAPQPTTAAISTGLEPVLAEPINGDLAAIDPLVVLNSRTFEPDPVDEDPPVAGQPCQTAPPTTETAEVPSETVADGTSPVFNDSFDQPDPTWQFLAGSWAIDDGKIVQSDPTGYDLIAALSTALPESVRVDVELQAIDVLSGGLLVGQPNPMTRAGAFTIDFTDGGQFLRWGGYNAESSVYSYLGGVGMPAGFDPSAPHQLGVELTPSGTTVFVDGGEVGKFGALEPGRVGLVTSVASVAFDNFSIAEIDDAS